MPKLSTAAQKPNLEMTLTELNIHIRHSVMILYQKETASG